MHRLPTRSLLALLPPRPNLNVFSNDDSWVIVNAPASDSPVVLPEIKLSLPPLSFPHISTGSVLDDAEDSLRVLDEYLSEIQRATTQLQALANVDEIRADFGKSVTQPELEAALQGKKYKLVCFTHVDTSTAVLSDAKMIGETCKRLAPESLVCRYALYLPLRLTVLAGRP